MRVLLDECLPLDFRHDLRGHQAHMQWAGFKGKKNRELLLAAESAGYEVLLTADQVYRIRLHAAAKDNCGYPPSLRYPKS
jgi:predicted nuclease of predicted toxin-antitoxin system